MKRAVWLVLAGLAWTAMLTAQSGDAGQSAPAPPQKPAAGAPGTGSANPFPDDTSTVPVMPTAATPIPGSEGDSRSYAASSAVSVAGDDADPVRSPDDPDPEAMTVSAGESSSSRDLDKILGPAGEAAPDRQDRKHRREAPQKQPTKKEAALEDITVGGYYLEKKNWRAAQSRYQSAMVMDPENPEVYWGLAESAYHLGDLAIARDNYLKVADYDPDGPHGKQLKKILTNPALLNAKPRPPAPAADEPKP